jgi:hypothetical protein
VVLQGGALPPAPTASALCEGEYTIYERDMANREVCAWPLSPKTATSCLGSVGCQVSGPPAGAAVEVHAALATCCPLPFPALLKADVLITPHPPTRALYVPARACLSCFLPPWVRC